CASVDSNTVSESGTCASRHRKRCWFVAVASDSVAHTTLRNGILESSAPDPSGCRATASGELNNSDQTGGGCRRIPEHLTAGPSFQATVRSDAYQVPGATNRFPS